MNGYQSFAAYYDLLTADIPYRARGEYFHLLLQKFGMPGRLLLDLACGTGSLSEVFADLGYEVIGADGSEEMLARAMEKKCASGRDILYLCQQMQELDLYGTIDGCVCALDSLNHITEPETLSVVFQKVGLFLAPGGIFLFDVNTPYKHEQILSDRTFVYDLDEVYCVWQNSRCENGVVEITLDLFGAEEDGSYIRETETFKERAYTHQEIEGFLEDGNMELLGYYGEDSLLPPKQDAQRVIYAARSKK